MTWARAEAVEAARRVVVTASRTRRTAPCADAAAPRRNRAEAITGAACVVLIFATWALRPLTFV